MQVPHEYVPSQLGHGEAQCKWCKGTNRENAIIDPNHCSVRAKRDPFYNVQPHSGMKTAPAEPIMQFFVWTHLPEHLQEISRPFGELAAQIVAALPRNPERSVALRKLLDAKDAAVRAKLFKEN